MDGRLKILERNALEKAKPPWVWLFCALACQAPALAGLVCFLPRFAGRGLEAAASEHDKIVIFNSGDVNVALVK